MKSKIKIFVGLSGGVDSAVSAALLKKEGYEVTGVFIKAWTPPGYPCTWKKDRRSAMRVAAILSIPFITLDLEKEYKKEVVDYMVAEYKRGRTPNPDVMCNKEIKFGHFLKFALKNGVDFVATGHYARTSLPNKISPESEYERTPLSLPRRGGQGGEVILLEGKDKNKDQSYFLWTLTQEQLKHILFPIGHLQKREVRKLAKKFNLPQATRKDSQGLCFLGKVDMKEFLSRYITPKKGSVLNKKGEIIGYHNGALFFTIGERHGFTITKKTDKDTPLYVVSKDIKKNTIIVAPKITPYKKNQGEPLMLQDINWVLGKSDLSKKCSCRVRYHGEKIKCKIENGRVILNKSQAGISSGQSLVLYDGEICLGGGIIK